MKITTVFLLISFVMTTEFQRSCSSDLECKAYYTNEYLCSNFKCIHSSTWPLNFSKFLGFLAIFIVSVITNASGLGGGPIFIPIFTVFFDFTIEDSIPLTQVTMFAGALVNLILSYDDRDQKNENQLLINYRLVNFITPLIQAGTMIGIIIMKVSPPLIIFIVFFAFIVYSTISMFIKAVS